MMIRSESMQHIMQGGGDLYGCMSEIVVAEADLVSEVLGRRVRRCTWCSGSDEVVMKTSDDAVGFTVRFSWDAWEEARCIDRIPCATQNTDRQSSSREEVIHVGGNKGCSWIYCWLDSKQWQKSQWKNIWGCWRRSTVEIDRSVNRAIKVEFGRSRSLTPRFSAFWK